MLTVIGYELWCNGKCMGVGDTSPLSTGNMYIKSLLHLSSKAFWIVVLCHVEVILYIAMSDLINNIFTNDCYLSLQILCMSTTPHTNMTHTFQPQIS